MRPEGYAEPFAVSIQNRVPQLDMRRVPLKELGPDAEQLQGPNFAAGGFLAFEFNRPSYIKTANVLLVVLIAIASLAGIFLTPMEGLAINTGTLVLGIWGIRAMLLGTDVKFITVVDLALIVIIVMLILITARLFWQVGAGRSVWPVRRFACGPGTPAVPLPEDPSPSSPP